MLYLYTGVPGAGKTLYAVSNLAKRKDFKDRPIFVDGIKDLDREKIPYLDIPEGESIQTWPNWAPPGAIIVVDECQRIFRPRPSGSKVPDYVAELETHLHRGLDFILITQHPRLIDVHLRGLIEHHTHIGKTNLGIRRKLEWTTGGAKDPESRANIRDALVSVYKLDKSAYGLYKSAEVHTKIKTKRSKVLLAIPVFLAMIGGGLYYFYDYWQTFSKPIETAKTAPVAALAANPDGVGTVSASDANVAAPSGQYPPKSASAPEPKPHLTEDDFKPVIDGQPWTAPIYNGQNKAVKTMPYPVACVKSEDRCTCYTEQATPIQDMKKSQCLDFVKNGIYNPYKERTAENAVQTVEKQQQPAPQQVAVMGGQSKPNLMYDGYVEAGAQFR
ncbi:zonular occludens toxin family protein [Neisseria sp.]|uniref:zonular occludens toxin family protein n=1 Tax=Neisseria sp. TaxID=192066 RepID=UPI0026DC6A27|nr:zonular occludens toxin domain-containing protein [Neisseria sp.]MDO4226828.1 zonular occludens toxin domain-containing protein [Neisseria sp.]